MWYKSASKTSTPITRAKTFVASCHMCAQDYELPRWLGQKQGLPAHAIVTRIVDDTNVWVEPSLREDDNESDGEGDDREGVTKPKQKKLKAKVAPIMGFIQRICARFPGKDAPECVQVHVPSQVLPKDRGASHQCFSQVMLSFVMLCWFAKVYLYV